MSDETLPTIRAADSDGSKPTHRGGWSTAVVDSEETILLIVMGSLFVETAENFDLTCESAPVALPLKGLHIQALVDHLRKAAEDIGVTVI